MKCFYHHDKDAVGVCRHCLKGICPDCAVDFKDGIACKNTCEEKAKATARLVSVNINAQKGLKTGRFMGPVFLSILGLIFLGWAWYCGDLFRFSGMAGMAFLGMGITTLIYNMKYIKPCEDEDS